jgi:hypothetical protein
MTYTAVNLHSCCNWPRPEDAHDTARPPPHPHASTHLTNNDGLRWKTDGRPPANGPPTATPQQRLHSPSTPARGPPRPPTPRPSPQQPTPPSQSNGYCTVAWSFFSAEHLGAPTVNANFVHVFSTDQWVTEKVTENVSDTKHTVIWEFGIRFEKQCSLMSAGTNCIDPSSFGKLSKNVSWRTHSTICTIGWQPLRNQIIFANRTFIFRFGINHKGLDPFHTKIAES